MRWRMQRASRGEDIYQQLARFGREQQDTIRRVLASVQSSVRWGRQPVDPSGTGRAVVGLER